MAISHQYKGQGPVRLNKWMAELGLCSRREAEALIAGGGVFVDEFCIEQPGHKINPGETLTLISEAETAIATKFTAVLNKPVGYVSAQPEDDQIPAARLLTSANAADGTRGPARDTSLAPLGRLDMDSHGLLLLSQDGVLAKAIIGPQHAIEKEYIVEVKGEVSAGRLTLLRNGLTLDNRKLKPAKVTHEGGGTLRFVLKEGRKRQIRRMCSLVNLKVVDLLRVRIGPLRLGDLKEGKWRLLTAHERAGLIKASLPPRPARLRDEAGKPVKKGRSMLSKADAQANRKAQAGRPRGGKSDDKRRGKPGGGKPRPPRDA